MAVPSHVKYLIVGAGLHGLSFACHRRRTCARGKGAGRDILFDYWLFDDWQAKGITSVLHEKRGGYGNNRASIYGLAKKAEREGVRILTGVKVTGFRKDERGTIAC